jgi:two-component system, NtrC family, sensor kinase
MLLRWRQFPRAGLLLLAWIAALAVVTWLVFEGRRVALERGERATAAFAALVEQQAVRTFQAVNLTLGAVGDAHHLTPRPAKDDPEFQQMMKRRAADIPFLRALFIIGQDGWIIHDTDYPVTPRVALADRPYFRAHQQDPARAGGVWPPLLSRSGTGWFLPVTRPLGRSGRFEGVVVAALQAEQFREQFRGVGLPAGYLIALFYLDGTLVSSYPGKPEDVGRRFAGLPVFARHLPKSSGSFWSEETMMPGERVVSYRLSQDWDLVVHVSRSKGDVLAEWRRTATAAAVAMLVLTLFLVWQMARLAHDRARRERERQQRMQAEKLEALGQLTGGIAHDVGNLLNVVAMNVALLRQGSSDPAIAARALAIMERAVDSGMQMIERLLSFARSRSITVTRVRLDTWLDAARALLPQVAGPRVTLDIDAMPDLPEVLCDTGQLDTAVVNLVINARDAMAGSGRISVRVFPCDESGAPPVTVGSPARFVCLAVQDSGPGMTEKVRRRAIEPFYTTKGEAGTGLGLSQVYGFMQQLGGNMSIDSAPDRGTTIHLFLPVAPAQP